MWRRRRMRLFGPAGSTTSTNCLKLSLVLMIFFLLVSFVTCESPPSPSSSSCGMIRNISCPFRLKGDNQKCDHPLSYELSCYNNRTLLNITSDHDDSYYYYVEDINYHNYSVRLVDPGLEKDNCSSLPLRSIQEIIYSFFDYVDLRINTIITLIDCPTPTISGRYIASSCSRSSSSSTSYRNSSNYYYNTTSFNSAFSYSSLEKYYSYVVVGDMTIAEVEDYCEVIKTALVSSQWPINITAGNASFSDIHDGMVFGFELSWANIFCANCYARGRDCDVNKSNNVYKCVDFPRCNLWNLTNYRLSFSCLRSNLDGIHDFLIDYRSTIEMIIGLIFAVRFSCGIPFLLALLVYKLRRRHLSVYDTIENYLQSHNNLMPIRYSYSEIKKITNNFKDKLGEGGFGTVYKGKLRSGILVAVKVMGKSKATGQEFINEVATIGMIHHVNVVQLIGFCFEGPKRALIYEFMPNGSLEKYIFPREDEEGSVSLSYEKMYEISYKVAGGIEYLHRGCDMQILHFDIKPHNILLDKNFNPTISDFGLAKLYATDDSIVTLTAARGTMGYMAPELFYKNIGGVSYKADVYSFGMLLMEMAGRRKNLNPFVDNSSQIYFPSWVYDQFSEGKELDMEDATEGERKLVKKMIIVAFSCIQMKPSDRPSMNKVLEMLEGDVELLVMPPKPFLCPQEAPLEDQHPTPPKLTPEDQGQNLTPTNLIVPSEDSITECSD